MAYYRCTGGGSIGSVENLLVPTLGTTTNNGVTCTNNGDGTYTLNGTATADNTDFALATNITIGSTAKLVGTPKQSTYDNARIFCYDGSNYYVDKGDGVTISATTLQYIYIRVDSGVTFTNRIFKPMLTTNLKATYKEFVKRVGGFTNLLSFNSGSGSINSMNYTLNDDGTITFNGTSTTGGYFSFVDITLSKGTYKMTGERSPSAGDADIYVYVVNKSTGAVISYGPFVTIDSDVEVLFRFWVGGGITLSNAVFKPMLTESLLPEIYDFVKGMNITTSGTVTLSSASSTLTIPHNLGSTPKKLWVTCLNGSSYSKCAYYDGSTMNVQYYYYWGTVTPTVSTTSVSIPYYGNSWANGTYYWIAMA